MGIKITNYNVICNLGADIEEVYERAKNGDTSHFESCEDVIKGKSVRLGKINCALPEIKEEKYNLRCNRILLKCLETIDIGALKEKYGADRIGVVVANTNTGVQEFETTGNIEHTKLCNPASFLKEYFKLENYCAAISTACSSGVKAFSIARELLNSDFCDAVIVAGVDEISKVPVFGFDSLEILSKDPSIPFSRNRNGMNIGEGAAVFTVEKGEENGIKILGIGETTDFYHPTTPNPEGTEAADAISEALNEAELTPNEIDYINLHGTGTGANDLMEGTAINKIFGETTSASSTKPLTGHCLGAAASVEIGLCCKILEKGEDMLFPHIYDGQYDGEIPKIKLVQKGESARVKNILCTSFGFGGTNAAIILGAKK